MCELNCFTHHLKIQKVSSSLTVGLEKDMNKMLCALVQCVFFLTMTRFLSAKGLQLDEDQVIQEVVSFMEAEPKYAYKITIGTDSRLEASGKADFVTAIVVHRIGNGGRYFWRRGNIEDRFHTLRDRIIKEVFLSLDVARGILEKLQAQLSESPKWSFEIHVDVGEEGPTSVMLQEVLGIVRAHNFEALTKPQSYAASSVADRHV